MDKPKYVPKPPIHGQFKPGQSGNPAGRPKTKRFRESLERVLKALDPEGNGDAAIDKLNAAQYARAMSGDVAAYKELSDRLDGKVPQAIGGTDELPGIRAFAWLDVLAPHEPTPPALEGSDTPQLGDRTEVNTEQPILNQTTSKST